VAITAGETIAGEAQQGTLRYVLIRPVGRTRLLVAKLVAVMGFVLVTLLVVAVTAYVLGVVLLGNEPSTVTTTFSGTSLTTPQLIERTGLALAYALLSMLGVAAVALFLSTAVRSPLAAAMGTLALLIGSSLLLTLDAAGGLRPYLVTRYWLSFVDLFRDPILWHDVVHGVILQAGYVVVFLGAAWANFVTKDITD
jgi:ABC-2 type transport system permease protein